MLIIATLLGTLVLGAIYCLAALGLNLIYSVSGILQLAQGNVMMVGAYIGFVITLLVPNLFLAFASALLGCGILGVLLYAVVFRPLAARGHLPPLAAGLMIATAIEEALRAGFFSGTPVQYPAAIMMQNVIFEIDGIGVSQAQLVIVLVVAGLVLGLHLLLSRTTLGLKLRAVAERPDCARMLGISVTGMSALGFAAGSALAGASGVLIALVFSYITPFIGDNLGLVALAICLFGGLGSLPGAVIGSFVLAFTEQASMIYLTSSFKDAIAFGVVVLIMLLLPQGLMGHVAAERP